MIAKRLRDGSPDSSAGTSESKFWMREQNGTKKFLKKVLDRAKKKCYNKRVACWGGKQIGSSPPGRLREQKRLKNLKKVLDKMKTVW